MWVLVATETSFEPVNPLVLLFEFGFEILDALAEGLDEFDEVRLRYLVRIHVIGR